MRNILQLMHQIVTQEHRNYLTVSLSRVLLFPKQKLMAQDFESINSQPKKLLQKKNQMASYASSASEPPSLPQKLHSSSFKLCRKSCLRRKRISFKVVQVIPARFNRAKPWRCIFRSWVQWCKSSVEDANHIPSWMKNWRT